MCRLLAFSFGEYTTQKEKIDLITSFRNLSETGMVPKGIDKGHRDGWGLSLYTKGNDVPFMYKTASSASLDDYLVLEDYFKDNILQSGLAHIRKKTVGEASRANSHPFVEGVYSFIHNGTVERGNGPYAELTPLCESVTDSERLFRHFLQIKGEKSTLKAYTEMIVSTRDNYPTYSALNTMLHDGKHIYISRVMNITNPQYTELDLENYYTLYLGKTSNGDMVVSSERLDYKDVSYILLTNNTICAINLETGTHELFSI